MKLEYKELSNALQVCAWINEHPMCQILSITEFRGFTIFYYDLTKLKTDHRVAYETIDPGFAVPSVPHVKCPPFTTTCTAIN